MKRNRRRPRMGQREFGFVPETFNLFAQATLDGERLAREQAEAERAREIADATQAALFPTRKRR